MARATDRVSTAPTLLADRLQKAMDGTLVQAFERQALHPNLSREVGKCSRQGAVPGDLGVAERTDEKETDFSCAAQDVS